MASAPAAAGAPAAPLAPAVPAAPASAPAAAGAPAAPLVPVAPAPNAAADPARAAVQNAELVAARVAVLAAATPAQRQAAESALLHVEMQHAAEAQLRQNIAHPPGHYIEYDTDLLEIFGWRPFAKDVLARSLSWSADVPRDAYHVSTLCATDHNNLAARVSALLVTHNRQTAIDQVTRCKAARRKVRDENAAKYAALNKQDPGAGSHQHEIDLLDELLVILNNRSFDQALPTAHSPIPLPGARIVVENGRFKGISLVKPIRDKVVAHMMRQIPKTTAIRAEDFINKGKSRMFGATGHNPAAISAHALDNAPNASLGRRNLAASHGGPARPRERGGRRTRRKNGRRRTQKKRKTYV